MKVFQQLIFISVIFLASCGNPTALHDEQSQPDPSFNLIQSSNKISQSPANQLQEQLQTEMDFNAVYIINSDSQIIIAIEPKQRDRFQLKSLREKAEGLIENHISSLDIEVSTDKKIALELQKLEEKLSQQSMSSKDLDKELTRIIKLSKEET